MTDRDKQLLINMILGGAAIGGGAGVLQSGTNYLNYLNSRAKAKNNKREDDDTLHLTIPAEKQASIGLGVGLAGGALSLLAANALARKIYQSMIKRPDMQAELEAAQHRHLQSLDESAQQKASAVGKSPGTMEMLTSLPISLSLLAALASGALTFNALNKTFPGVKRPQNPLPKRVKITREPGSSPEAAQIAERIAQEELDAPGTEDKIASWDADDESAAWDNLAHLILLSKTAAVSDAADWVYAVASGRLQELEETFGQLGFDAACDMMKGASATPVSDRAVDLAILYLTKSASLGPSFQLLVAAEAADCMTPFVKIAASLEPEDSNALIAWFASDGAANRASCLIPWILQQPSEKEAGFIDEKKTQNSSHTNKRRLLRQMLQKEIDDDSKDDKKTVKDRLNNSQNMLGTAPERGDGKSEDGTSLNNNEKENLEIPEVVMGLK